MNRSLRIGTAISAVALAGILTGCASGQQSRESIFGAKVDHSNIGLATRAQVALAAKDYSTAIDLAEQAVQNSPNDAGFRGVLGNCYFAAGRFTSAEAAYRDALSLHSQQPQVVLKLALSQIALGKSAQALTYLEAARDFLEPADYGLAVALAGYPADAVAVLTQAARSPAADARVRQNLALAHALTGDWTMARTVAAQDLSPDQVGPRIQQWMAMAKPANPATQVAALTGVTPAADPGLPVRLALHVPKSDQRMAEAIPAPKQAKQPEPAFASADYAPPAYVAPPEPPQSIAEEVAQLPRTSTPQLPTIVEAFNAPSYAPPVEPAPKPKLTQALLHDAAKPLVQPAATPVDALPTRFGEQRDVAAYVAITDKVRKVAARKSDRPSRASGKANAVVQLGAYSSPDRVEAAWDQFAKRFASLNRYTPVSARFDGPRGTVYRLSVKGFASAGEAQQVCSGLQKKGKNCFVRRVAGDSPVQFASR